jgi:hypothetical protein
MLYLAGTIECKPVSPWLDRWICCSNRVCEATADRGSALVHCGGQCHGAQIGTEKEAKEVRQPLTVAWEEKRHQTFCPGQFTDEKPVAGLFQPVPAPQGDSRPLLVGDVAFNRVDDNHGVEIIKHSRASWSVRTPCSLQFPVAVSIF